MSILSKSSRNNQYPSKLTNGWIIALTVIGLAVLGALGIALDCGVTDNPSLRAERRNGGAFSHRRLSGARTNATDLVLPGSIQAVQEPHFTPVWTVISNSGW